MLDMTSYEVSPRFWSDDLVRTLTPDAKLVMLYLLTGPQSDGIGIFRMYPQVGQEETGLGAGRFLRALHELTTSGKVRWEGDRRVVWVVNRLRYRFPKGISEPQAKGVIRCLEDLPQDSQILQAFTEHYQGFLEGLPQGLGKGFLQPFRARLSSASASASASESKGSPNPSRPTPTFPGPRHEAVAILSWLNKKTGKHFRPKPVNLELIEARLRDGITPAQLRAIVTRKAREWIGDPKTHAWLRPATLFGKTKCEQYLGELPPLPPEETDDAE